MFAFGASVMSNEEEVVSEGSESEDRVSKLEREVERLKADVRNSSKEIKQTVEDLKKAVVDIRSAVSEIENPFNLLRVITSEKDLEKLSGVQPKIERIQIVKEESKEKTEEEKPESLPAAEKEIEETRKHLEEQIMEAALGGETLGFQHNFSLIRWIYNMFDLGFDSSDLKGICQCCEYVGVIPKGSSVHISNVIDALAAARAKGFSEEDIMLVLYMAAEAFGVGIKTEELREMVMSMLKRKRIERVKG